MSSSIAHPPDLPLHGHHVGASGHSPVRPGDIAVGVIIGRTSEYFDFFVYGIASVLVFPAVFFPFEANLDGTLYAFVIFSFAFIARPIGSFAFLVIQRRYGRGVEADARAVPAGRLHGRHLLPAGLRARWA